MVISGYYLSISNTRNIVKVLSLYAIAVLFSLSTNIVSSILNGNFIIVEILKSFIIGNYFLLLYSAVYILSPFINIVFENISKQSFRLLLGIMFLMFSIYPTFIEYLFGVNKGLMGYSFVSFFDRDGHGYTLVNFMFMYVIGAYLRKYGMPLKSRIYCFIIYVVSSIIMSLVMCYTQKVELNYFSPVCIIAAISLFNCFALMKPSNLKIVNYLSSTVFGIFIVHGFVIYQVTKFISIEDVVSKSIAIRLGGIVLVALIVFAISMSISIILSAIVNKTIAVRLSKAKYLSYKIK